jgi:hypothetical protein
MRRVGFQPTINENWNKVRVSPKGLKKFIRKKMSIDLLKRIYRSPIEIADDYQKLVDTNQHLFLAMCPSTPIEILEQIDYLKIFRELIDDKERDVYNIALNPHLPLDMIEELYNSGTRLALSGLALNSQTPVEMLCSLSDAS